MANFFNRIVDFDDLGDEISGTEHDNDWLQSLYDSLEEPFDSSVTTTTTGTTTHLATSTRYTYCNNASLYTIQGMAAGVHGQLHTIFSVGAGQVDLANQHASAAAAEQILCGVTGTRSLAAGVGIVELKYDANASRWRVVTHEQGAWISVTFSAAYYTANGGMTWTVGSGDVTTMAYYLRGRTLTVAWYLVNTTVGGSASSVLQLTNNLWGGFTAAKTMLNPMVYSDNAGGNAQGLAQVTQDDTVIQLFKNATNWTVPATNATNLLGQITFEVK